MSIYAVSATVSQKLPRIEFLAIKPWSVGNIPPPQTITINNPDATAVYLPKPVTARLNIAPHITDVQSPQRIKNTAFIGICTELNESVLESNPKNDTISSFAQIPADISAIAIADVTASIVRLDTFEPIIPPTNRPTSINSQYKPTTVPAIAAGAKVLLFFTNSLLSRYWKHQFAIPTSTPT